MPRARTGEGVSDLVQKNLVHVVVAFALGKIAREGNAPLRMITLTKPCFRVIKIKRPALTLEV